LGALLISQPYTHQQGQTRVLEMLCRCWVNFEIYAFYHLQEMNVARRLADFIQQGKLFS